MPVSVLAKVLYCLRHFEEGFLLLEAVSFLTDKATCLPRLSIQKPCAEENVMTKLENQGESSLG